MFTQCLKEDSSNRRNLFLLEMSGLACGNMSLSRKQAFLAVGEKTGFIPDGGHTRICWRFHCTFFLPGLCYAVQMLTSSCYVGNILLHGTV